MTPKSWPFTFNTWYSFKKKHPLTGRRINFACDCHFFGRPEFEKGIRWLESHNYKYHLFQETECGGTTYFKIAIWKDD